MEGTSPTASLTAIGLSGPPANTFLIGAPTRTFRDQKGPHAPRSAPRHKAAEPTTLSSARAAASGPGH